MRLLASLFLQSKAFVSVIGWWTEALGSLLFPICIIWKYFRSCQVGVSISQYLLCEELTESPKPSVRSLIKSRIVRLTRWSHEIFTKNGKWNLSIANRALGRRKFPVSWRLPGVSYWRSDDWNGVIVTYSEKRFGTWLWQLNGSDLIALRVQASEILVYFIPFVTWFDQVW